MNPEISKTNDNLAFFNVRLDEVRMSGHERMRAKAHMAQAEAIADAVFAVFGFGGRLLKSLAARPARRPTPSAG
jgi:hypothetical protein